MLRCTYSSRGLTPGTKNISQVDLQRCMTPSDVLASEPQTKTVNMATSTRAAGRNQCRILIKTLGRNDAGVCASGDWYVLA